MRKVFALHGELSVHGLEKAQRGLKTFDDRLKVASRQLMKTGRQVEKLGMSFTKAFTLPIAIAGGAILKFGADFEKAMSTSTAIMGDVSDEMRKKMEDMAKTVSTKTTHSASELAKAYYYLASAGFTAEQSISALGSIAKFAEAGQFDLQQATDLLTDAQSALGLTVKDVAKNEENMVRVSDVLVRANTLANASVEQFSEALTTRAGAALRILGKDVEEGAAVLAAYADQGVKVADAGTQFGIVLRDLQKAALKNTGVFKKYNVAVYDGSGEMRNMADILSDLERALEGKSDLEKKSILTMMKFQEKSVASLLTLIGTSDKIREYEAALRKAGGTTEDVADKQLNNLQDQLKIIRNRLVNAAIALSNDLLPALKNKFVPWAEKTIQKTQGMITWFRGLPPPVKNTTLKILALTATIGPFLIVLGSAMKVVAALRTQVLLLNAALLANPITLTILAVGGLTAGIIALTAAVLKNNGVFGRSTEELKKHNDQLERGRELRRQWREELKKNPEADPKEFKKQFEERYKSEQEYAINSFNQIEITRQKHTKKEKKEEEEKRRLKRQTDKETKEALAASNIKARSQQENAKKQEQLEIQRLQKIKERNTQEVAEKESVYRDEYEAYYRLQEAEINSKEDSNANVLSLLELRHQKELDFFDGTEREKEYLLQAHAQERANIVAQIEKRNAQEIATNKQNIINESISAYNGLFDTINMAYDNQAKKIDYTYDVEKRKIEELNVSDEERQKLLDELDKKTDKKKRALRRKAAIVEKAQGLFSIGINTAVAIMHAWATLPKIVASVFTGVLAGIGAAQAAIVAAAPIPQAAKGLFIKGGKGGTLVEAGEANQDEIILPLKTGVAELADALYAKISKSTRFIFPTMGPAAQPVVAGAGGGNSVHLHIGTLVADERGLKELDRRMSQYRYAEADRRGAR